MAGVRELRFVTVMLYDTTFDPLESTDAVLVTFRSVPSVVTETLDSLLLISGSGCPAVATPERTVALLINVSPVELGAVTGMVMVLVLPFFRRFPGSNVQLKS